MPLHCASRWRQQPLGGVLCGNIKTCPPLKLSVLLPADRGFIVPVAGGSNLLAVYSANASAVVLAFGGSNETLANVTANNPLETDAFYKGAFSNQGNGSVDPVLADPFQGRIGGGYQGLYRVCCSILDCTCTCMWGDLGWCAALRRDAAGLHGLIGMKHAQQLCKGAATCRGSASPIC